MYLSTFVFYAPWMTLEYENRLIGMGRMDLSFESDRYEWTTLMQSCSARRRRWGFSISFSSMAHGLVVLALCWPVTPVFVKPSLLAHGEGGSATPVSVVLYVPNDLQIATQPPLLSLPVAAQKKTQRTKMWKRNNVLQEEKQPTIAAEAGSELGSAYDGSTSGDEVKPAIPVVFPDLKIGISELPNGVEGEVVVELTIDALGNVVEEKLLKGLGHGVDERVIALLRGWRFRPATRNGVAIPSKQDALFRYPS
jgi:TonB family protein